MSARADRTDISADQTSWTADGSMPLVIEVGPIGAGIALRDPEIQPVDARLAQFDDRDLLETVPIIMGIINAARR
jgi:hypothetical protein